MNMIMNKLKYILIGIIILLGLYAGFQHHQQQVYKQQVQNHTRMIEVLNDSLKTSINKYSEVVNEKKTLNFSLKNLEKTNHLLTDNQQQLTKRIDKLTNKNQLLAASLVQQEVVIDSMKLFYTSNSINKINYEYEGEYMQANYSFIKYDSSLQVNNIMLKNSQFVSFEFEKDKAINFSVTNSNPYFKNANIDSYVIPTADKKNINPNFWDKTKRFFKNNGKQIIIFGAGYGAGKFF